MPLDRIPSHLKNLENSWNFMLDLEFWYDKSIYTGYARRYANAVCRRLVSVCVCEGVCVCVCHTPVLYQNG